MLRFFFGCYSYIIHSIFNVTNLNRKSIFYHLVAMHFEVSTVSQLTLILLAGLFSESMFTERNKAPNWGHINYLLLNINGLVSNIFANILMLTLTIQISK